MSQDSFRAARSALHALAIMAALQGRALDREHLFRELDPRAAPEDVLRAARRCGLRGRWVERGWKRQPGLPLPAVIRHRDGGYGVLAKRSPEGALVYAPEATEPQLLGPEEYARDYGEGILLLRRRGEDGARLRSGLGWLLPALARHRGIYRDVLLATLALQGLALALPLAFQAVIDKVLAHRGLATLDLVAAALVAAMLFEVLLGGLRGYLLAHSGCRVDALLAAGLFRRLLALPLAYFRARPAGDSVARLRELESLRALITGAALTVLTELPFVLVFLGVLFLYSPLIAGVVAATLPGYLLAALLLTPLLRRQLDERMRRGADSHAFLVEAVDGIETVKSLSVEPRFQRRWEELTAHGLRATFAASQLQNAGAQVSMLLGRATTVAILWLGARLAMSGELSIGQLVACNMLAARVTGPVQRLAQVWHEVQQAVVSLRRLDDVLTTPPEPRPAAGALCPPRLAGALALEGLRFRYRPDRPPVLDGVSFRIDPGEMVALVGPSGTGKTTVGRLLLSLHQPEAGRLVLDGFDLRQLDPLWLRRHIGWVPQDAPLFDASVRDNIAGFDPTLPAEAIVRAARLAGAHELILTLCQGYDTRVGEHGAALSGGQRQRIALARALVRSPRILILDEVSSALDAEAECALRGQLGKLRQGRTVLLVTHRLDLAALADRVVVLAAGRVAEQGRPADLIAGGGEYARLHRLQQGDGASLQSLGGAA